MKNNITSIEYQTNQNYKYNAIIVGWLGVIVSSVMLYSSFMATELPSKIGLLLQEYFLMGLTQKEQHILLNLLAILSRVSTGLSLANIGVNLLLLAGLAKDSNLLVWPWLIFHSALFGFSIYVAFIFVIAGLFVDVSGFLLSFLVFALVMVIFYKIYHEVFALAYTMLHQKRATYQDHNNVDSERALAAYMPHMTSQL